MDTAQQRAHLRSEPEDTRGPKRKAQPSSSPQSRRPLSSIRKHESSPHPGVLNLRFSNGIMRSFRQDYTWTTKLEFPSLTFKSFLQPTRGAHVPYIRRAFVCACVNTKTLHSKGVTEDNLACNTSILPLTPRITSTLPATWHALPPIPHLRTHFWQPAYRTHKASPAASSRQVHTSQARTTHLLGLDPGSGARFHAFEESPAQTATSAGRVQQGLH